MTERDLFGQVPEHVVIANATRAKKTGYAADPGTGPDGEFCRTCRYKRCNAAHSKNYWKCTHDAAPEPTHGPGTDIKLKSPACKYWEASDD